MTNHTQAAHGRRTRPRPRRTAALAALAVAQFMVVLDSSIVNVALPTIRSEPGLTAAQSSWVLDGYLLTIVSDLAADASRLLVLDAHDLTPTAEVHLPRRVPSGIHGS